MSDIFAFLQENKKKERKRLDPIKATAGSAKGNIKTSAALGFEPTAAEKRHIATIPKPASVSERIASKKTLREHSRVITGPCSHHCFIFTPTNEVIAFGNDLKGQLGLGRDPASVVEPHLVDSSFFSADSTPAEGEFDAPIVIDLATGEGHTLFCTDEGTIYATGDNQYGQGGCDPREVVEQACPYLIDPALFTSPIAMPVRFIKVACGAHHCVAVSSVGEVFTWGRNHHGTLGLPHATDVWQPQQVPSLKHRITEVTCGEEHTIVMSDKGILISWGENSSGQLGIGNTKFTATPSPVDKGNFWDDGNRVTHEICSIAAGRRHTVALSKDNYVFVWGSNSSGQLGVRSDHVRIHSKPHKIAALKEVGVRHIACGSESTIAVTRNGQVYAWGNNEAGQLGIGDRNAAGSRAVQPTPTPIGLFDGAYTVSNIGAGMKFTIGVSIEGKIFSWGNNSHGQLGISRMDERGAHEPKRARALEGMVKRALYERVISDLRAEITPESDEHYEDLIFYIALFQVKSAAKTYHQIVVSNEPEARWLFLRRANPTLRLLWMSPPVEAGLAMHLEEQVRSALQTRSGVSFVPAFGAGWFEFRSKGGLPTVKSVVREVFEDNELGDFEEDDCTSFVE